MRVLIVEDDPHMRKNLHEALARAEFSIDTAKNGREALSLADKKPYDLILLDVMMPGLDGYSVLKTLRQEGHEAAIFMITGMGAIDDRLRGFNDGADDYVVKPFSIAELMARIAAVMRRIKKSEHVLTVGELRLDIKNGQVERSGRMILLRRKECELLEYFMCHPGEVLSQQRIARHIWGLDSGSNYNTIEVHVKNLRAKLDAGFERSIIETLRGYGYTLKAA